jgi:hypothetical protein
MSNIGTYIGDFRDNEHRQLSYKGCKKLSNNSEECAPVLVPYEKAHQKCAFQCMMVNQPLMGLQNPHGKVNELSQPTLVECWCGNSKGKRSEYPRVDTADEDGPLFHGGSWVNSIYSIKSWKQCAMEGEECNRFAPGTKVDVLYLPVVRADNYDKLSENGEDGHVIVTKTGPFQCDSVTLGDPSHGEQKQCWIRPSK